MPDTCTFKVTGVAIIEAKVDTMHVLSAATALNCHCENCGFYGDEAECAKCVFGEALAAFRKLLTDVEVEEPLNVG